MRILITGAGGLLGGRLATLLSGGHEITGVVRAQPAPEGIPTLALDLTDEAAVTAAVRDHHPAVIIHSAARADAELCEREPEQAHRDNVLATRILAGACRKAGARFITISTDLVLEVNGPSPTKGPPPSP